MRIQTPFMDDAGESMYFEINGGPSGWLVIMAGDLDRARHCETMPLAIEAIINATADMARAIVAEHCISIAQRYVSQGLVEKAILDELTEALAQETQQ